MKICSFLVLTFAFLATGVNTRAQVKLSGHISNSTSEEILLHVLVDGKYFTGVSTKTTLDKNGNFTFNLKIDKPGFVSLHNDFLNSKPGGPVRLFLYPTTSDSLSFDQHDFKNSLTFYGVNAQQNTFINNPIRLREKYFRGSRPNTSELALKKDTSAEKAFEKVIAMRDDELRQLKDFATENHLQHDFVKAMEWDIRYYYINLFNGVVFSHYADSIRGISTIFNEEWGRYWDKAMHLEKVSNDQALASYWYYNYTGEYSKIYQTMYKEKLNYTGDDRQEGKQHTKHAEVTNKYFSGKALENVLANLLFDAAYQLVNEKSLIGLYEQFVKKYPDSRYTKYLTPQIQPIIAYHAVKTDQLNEGIHIYEGYDAINTFEELVEPFKGKVIYLDLWATWCAPCIEEFSNLDALKEHFKDSKQVKFLYLSIDKDHSRKNKWKTFMNLYNLKGIHFMANENLNSAIRKKFGSLHKSGQYALSIPRYIIINQKGEVVESTAKRPSDRDALYKQIEQFF
jgi:thiol-disulfide isomerase/thioredoxin